MSSVKCGAYNQKETNFHLLPGRLRMGVPVLLNNGSIAGQFANRVIAVPGVKYCKANPVTGQVLIKFDRHRTDLGPLLSLISGFDHESSKPDNSRTGVKNTPRHCGLKRQIQNKQTIPSKGYTSWHILDSSEALEKIQSTLETGLTQNVVRKRLTVYGPNELQEGPRVTFWKVALMSLNGFMTKLLLAAGGISLLIG